MASPSRWCCLSGVRSSVSDAARGLARRTAAALASEAQLEANLSADERATLHEQMAVIAEEKKK